MERSAMIEELQAKGIMVSKFCNTDFLTRKYNEMKADEGSKRKVGRSSYVELVLEEIPSRLIGAFRDQVLRKYKRGITQERAWVSRRALVAG